MDNIEKSEEIVNFNKWKSENSEKIKKLDKTEEVNSMDNLVKIKKSEKSYGRFSGKVEILPKLGGKTYKTIQRAKELTKDNSVDRIVIVVDTEADKRLMQEEANFESDKIKIFALNETNGKIIDIFDKLYEYMRNSSNEIANPKILLDISNTNIIRWIITRLPYLKYIDLVCIPLEQLL